MKRAVPFSMFLHAGTDLYRDQVFLRQKLLHADNIFVVCEFNRHFVRSLYPKTYPRLEPKIHLHHLGLELEQFVFQPARQESRTLLAVGSLERIKGFDVLIQALGRLAKRRVDVDVELIGDGPEREPLRQLAADVGVAGRIRFRGLLPFDEVRKAMARAAILVHPSNGLGDAVPTVIKEALALGTPVIASNVAGIPELLDDGGCGTLVPPGDALALAASIEHLLGDHDRRRRLAFAGRRQAERRFDLWRNGRELAARLGIETRGTPRVVTAV
jgi:glycosyltransferase involved in cell wall biosynthesis